MKIKLPWSDWLVDQGKKRKKIESWQIAHVSLEEELNLELILRTIYNHIPPEEMPDFISQLAVDHYKLIKVVNQAGIHIDSINSKLNDAKS